MVKINEDIKAEATSINDQMKNKISRSEFNELDAKIKVAEKIPSIEDYNKLQNRIENLDNKVSDHFTTVHESIPFPIVIDESNSGFDGHTVL